MNNKRKNDVEIDYCLTAERMLGFEVSWIKINWPNWPLRQKEGNFLILIIWEFRSKQKVILLKGSSIHAYYKKKKKRIHLIEKLFDF